MAFANQTVLLTGASSGIGRALARALAAEGCRVGLTARRRELLEALQAEITAAGGRAAGAAADVGDRVATLAALHELQDRLGPADLLIANAGIGMPPGPGPLNGPGVEQLFRTNFLGVVHAFEAVLPGMLERGRGHLVAVSSVAAYKGLPGEAAYCASKAAVNTYLEGLRIQYQARGVAVTAVCPGFVRTPMTAGHRFRMPWLMDADEAARRIVRALRRRPAVYNFPWQMALLMRLTRWMPDRLVARIVERRHVREAPDPAPPQAGVRPTAQEKLP